MKSKNRSCARIRKSSLKIPFSRIEVVSRMFSISKIGYKKPEGEECSGPATTRKMKICCTVRRSWLVGPVKVG